MKFAIGGFATTVFALLAIAIAPLAAADAEDDFVGALARSGLSFPPQAKSGVINAGHTVCQGFSNGASYKQVVEGVSQKGLGANRSLAGTFVQAAARTLCPQYLPEVG
jgi:hypothetical protein